MLLLIVITYLSVGYLFNTYLQLAVCDDSCPTLFSSMISPVRHPAELLWLIFWPIGIKHLI